MRVCIAYALLAQSLSIDNNRFLLDLIIELNNLELYKFRKCITTH